MLSRINSKLKSENENLRSEVKDYKLLRKVFGYKQIDDLLEQVRNIKGRKVVRILGEQVLRPFFCALEE